MTQIENTLGGQAVVAWGINNKGTIVGAAEDSNGYVAMMVKDGVMISLGEETPLNVNDRDQAVGILIDWAWVHPILYENGTTIDLNYALPGSLIGGYLTEINNYGWAVGIGIDLDNNFYAFLLVPLYPKGDYDGDEDVDLHDAGHFMRCYAAEPYQGPEGGLHVGCSVFDFDDDADLDVMDYAAFQYAFTGPVRSGW